MTTPSPTPRPRRRMLIALVCVAASGAAPAQEPAPLPDPADAAAPTPPATAGRSMPEGAGNYLDHVDAPRLPWTRLFRPGGSFVPESELTPGAAAMAQPGSGTGHGHGSAPAVGADAPAVQASMPGKAGGSDARGVVRAVDPAQGKLTLKHGPIERLEMPGMTMVFRVKDKALLEGVSKGDEVGFDVEIDGTTFYVTGIRK